MDEITDLKDSSVSSEQLEKMAGAFVESLRRNNKRIRDDRAVAICEDAEMIYKREIEDMRLEIKKLRREREAMLDLSPTDTTSLVLISDFDAKAFCQRDMDLGVKIRDREIRLEIAETRYKNLFTAKS